MYDIEAKKIRVIHNEYAFVTEIIIQQLNFIFYGDFVGTFGKIEAFSPRATHARVIIVLLPCRDTFFPHNLHRNS